MKNVPFVKYTSCGNNFVIVDETEGRMLSESEMGRFAYEATNTAFGIGCDNLLVIQRCTSTTLRTIANERPYWHRPPDSSQAEFIFRMFEPSGEEALCCGNGLMSIADYLYKCHGIDNTTIMTEVPLPAPRVLIIGSADGGHGSWANMGHPRRTPAELAKPGVALPHEGIIDRIGQLTVEFRSHDLDPHADSSSLTLSGYLVFTGEPHLVVFPDQDFSMPYLADSIFASLTASRPDAPRNYNRVNFGSWLVHRIGCYVNTHRLDLFPAGLNINFARLHDVGVVEYRCFERGINRETLACGTGALAVAYVASQLHGVGRESIDVLPHRCRWHDPDARIRVQHTESGWLLNTNPVMLFDGIYRLVSGTARPQQTPDSRSNYADQYLPQSEGQQPPLWTTKTIAVPTQ